jgi:hypothetical protein
MTCSDRGYHYWICEPTKNVFYHNPFRAVFMECKDCGEVKASRKVERMKIDDITTHVWEME